MSLVISSEGSRLNSSHVHLLGSSTSPTTEKSHASRGVRGVGPAERTGKPSSRYWPGGSFVSGPLRRPPKPREINPSRMFRPSSLVRVPSGPCVSPLIGRLSSRPTAPSTTDGRDEWSVIDQRGAPTGPHKKLPLCFGETSAYASCENH